MREEEDLDLALNLSYVSVGTVWDGTVRVRRGPRGSRRWNMSIISWQPKIFNYPNEWAEAEAEADERKEKSR